ncbi:serine hydrolase domain-containing protein [Nocardiopsis algeriensis]|uniref:CubicO group peptidase (Beta-lactamase class C family) n=1 Tax=Nocardiopsis algeriensis TaxID=1478215 RepID=A0A841IRE1_9ACTN|nr:CubicO group peptidase (beta-lactamase class C family) [Nocardiopsis algeriensis]
MSRRTLTVAAACLVAALVAALGIAVAPRAPGLSAEETGDPGLRDRARPLFADGTYNRVGIVEIDGDTTRHAHFGADEGTDYEIGSVTKTMTALLLADAVERGEVTEDTRLGDLLDLDGTPAAEVTLAELASHRSGLPRLSPRLRDMVSGTLEVYRGGDPYRVGPDTLLAQAAAAELDGRGESRYSNLGHALLGLALARAAGTDYPSLLRERLLDPLGMDTTLLPATEDDLPEDATAGLTGQGRTAAPWLARAYAPAGGVRSTPADMEHYARALLDGTAPGTAALEPRWEAPGGCIGYAWMLTDTDGTDVTWHNGGTGGFSAMIALDREAGRAVVVLADTTTGVEAQALELLTGEEAA